MARQVSRIAFYGSLWCADHDEVVAILGEWVEASALDTKTRLFGEEIVYESDQLYFYCYSVDAPPGVGESFLIEGHILGSLEDARSSLRRLSSACAGLQVDSDLEYVEVDTEGKEVSDHFQLR